MAQRTAQQIPRHSVPHNNNGAGYTGFSMKGSQFSHVMVILNAYINAFYNNRPLVCFDGGHMKSGGGVLYIAITLNPNKEILLLAWVIAENESTNTWRQFLRRFYEHVTPIEWAKALGPPDGSPAQLTVITDRQKGLGTAVTEVKPDYMDVWHYYCTQHLAENVRQNFDQKAEKLFRKACQVRTQAEFNKILADIKLHNPLAYDYITVIPPEKYAYYAAPLRDFPHFS